MRVIISGGGTGGHVYPAIAVADRLRELDPEVDILFVGALGKMEMEKVPQAGYRIEGLNIRGLQRKLTVANLSFPFRLIGSLIKARKLIRQFKPDVVAGFGGYASGPTLYMASLKGIPTVIQEQNSYPGITNKLLAGRARKICVAYQGMEKFFPKESLRLTGNPVRKDLHHLEDKRAEACKHFGLEPDKKTLLLFGGSLGARTLNNAMSAATKILSERDDIQVLWQMGKLYAEQFGTSSTAQLSHVRAQAFIDRMDLAYSVADVVICRAGASTISELCLAGITAILVPSPNVAEDHQTQNALALVNVGAAEMVTEAEAETHAVRRALELMMDRERCESFRRQIRSLAMPFAADEIAGEIISAAGS
ncbi:MAG: undecaprenyldiphospho-muramoylpentapeptide beta-N-acetylglucosaminyltransferase [Bacteroidetes bacterium]|nr:MAG: undecaprenyldiphospho-muramoylpentapeptide beta-N-acetylglucosaminyltransferase [Bacteroidota bacterium]